MTSIMTDRRSLFQMGGLKNNTASNSNASSNSTGMSARNLMASTGSSMRNLIGGVGLTVNSLLVPSSSRKKEEKADKEADKDSESEDNDGEEDSESEEDDSESSEEEGSEAEEEAQAEAEESIAQVPTTTASSTVSNTGTGNHYHDSKIHDKPPASVALDFEKGMSDLVDFDDYILEARKKQIEAEKELALKQPSMFMEVTSGFTSALGFAPSSTASSTTAGTATTSTATATSSFGAVASGFTAALGLAPGHNPTQQPPPPSNLPDIIPLPQVLNHHKPYANKPPASNHAPPVRRQSVHNQTKPNNGLAMAHLSGDDKMTQLYRASLGLKPQQEGEKEAETTSTTNEEETAKEQDNQEDEDDDAIIISSQEDMSSLQSILSKRSLASTGSHQRSRRGSSASLLQRSGTNGSTGSGNSNNGPSMDASADSGSRRGPRSFSRKRPPLDKPARSSSGRNLLGSKSNSSNSLRGTRSNSSKSLRGIRSTSNKSLRSSPGSNSSNGTGTRRRSNSNRSLRSSTMRSNSSKSLRGSGRGRKGSLRGSANKKDAPPPDHDWSKSAQDDDDSSLDSSDSSDSDSSDSRLDSDSDQDHNQTDTKHRDRKNNTRSQTKALPDHDWSAAAKLSGGQLRSSRSKRISAESLRKNSIVVDRMKRAESNDGSERSSGSLRIASQQRKNMEGDGDHDKSSFRRVASYNGVFATAKNSGRKTTNKSSSSLRSSFLEEAAKKNAVWKTTRSNDNIQQLVKLSASKSKATKSSNMTSSINKSAGHMLTDESGLDSNLESPPFRRSNSAGNKRRAAATKKTVREIAPMDSSGHDIDSSEASGTKRRDKLDGRGKARKRSTKKGEDEPISAMKRSSSEGALRVSSRASSGAGGDETGHKKSSNGRRKSPPETDLKHKHSSSADDIIAKIAARRDSKPEDQISSAKKAAGSTPESGLKRQRSSSTNDIIAKVAARRGSKSEHQISNSQKAAESPPESGLKQRSSSTNDIIARIAALRGPTPEDQTGTASSAKRLDRSGSAGALGLLVNDARKQSSTSTQRAHRRTPRDVYKPKRKGSSNSLKMSKSAGAMSSLATGPLGLLIAEDDVTNVKPKFGKSRSSDAFGSKFDRWLMPKKRLSSSDAKRNMINSKFQIQSSGDGYRCDKYKTAVVSQWLAAQPGAS